MLIKRFFSNLQFGSKNHIEKWINSVNSKATTPEGKNYSSQLTSLINYFNKNISDYNRKDIDWDKYKDEIVTDGIVDKIKNNFDSHNKETYQVEKIANDIINEPSEEYNNITKELIYHNKLWRNYYFDQSMFLYQLDKISNMNDYYLHDIYDMFDGAETELMELVETNNYFPNSKDDIPINNYIHSQFHWGKKITSFYKHPTDDYKVFRATDNLMGK